METKLYIECERLANHFLANCKVDDPQSQTQRAADFESLSVAIQEAVEDWFYDNPNAAQASS